MYVHGAFSLSSYKKYLYLMIIHLHVSIEISILIKTKNATSYKLGLQTPLIYKFFFLIVSFVYFIRKLLFYDGQKMRKII